jgi:VWFA-related protein
MNRQRLFPAAVLLAVVPAGGVLVGGVGVPRASASPQELRPDTLPPVGVELVQVDAVVTDKQGRLVSGLSGLDFELREDGKVQALSYFGVEGKADADMVAAPPALPRDLPEGALPPVTRPPAERPRQIVLVVDDLHISPANLATAKTALLRFVTEQIEEDDRVALVTTSGQTGHRQSLTRDRADLKRAIQRLNLLQQRRVPHGEVPTLTEFQAEAIERGDPEALRVAVQEILQENDDVDESLARLQAYQRAHSMLVEVMNYSSQALSTLESVVRSLAPVSGRKVIVLASDGFLIGLGSSDTRHFDVRRITDAATRADVVLYSLDTRGLVGATGGGDATFGGPPVFAAPGGRESLNTRSVEALRDSLNALAEDSGGFLVRNANDLNAGLGRILKQSQFAYVLAYEPKNKKRDGGFRRIEVRLRSRPDFKVRARRGYFAPDDKKDAKAKAASRSAGAAEPSSEGAPESEEAARDRALFQALGSLFPLDGIPVRISADYVDLPPEGPRAVVKALVDVRNVGFEKKEQAYEADLEIAGALFDETGALVSEIAGERSRLKLPLENTQAYREQGLLYEKAIAVKPGRYEVRLVVRDARSSLLGSSRQEVEVFGREAMPLSLSSVFLSADDGKAEPGPTNLRDIQVEKQLRRGQGLHYLVYVYRPDGATGTPSDVVLQAQVWAGEKLQGVGPSHKVAFPDTGSAFPRQAERIATDGLGPGTYELRLVASDRTSGDKAVGRASFTVE